MIEIEVVREITFDSAHYLPGYDGPCGSMHGHTYRLQIGVSGKINQKTGMVVDFKHIDNVLLSDIKSVVDHKTLNDVKALCFPNQMPTAENMVFWIFELLGPYFAARNLDLSFIKLWETPDSFAQWRRR